MNNNRRDNTSKKISRIGQDIASDILDRYIKITCEENSSQSRFRWPDHSLVTVAINDGFILSSEMIDKLSMLERRLSPEGVYFWSIFSNDKQIYQSKYGFEMMNWIESEISKVQSQYCSKKQTYC